MRGLAATAPERCAPSPKQPSTPYVMLPPYSHSIVPGGFDVTS